MCGRTKDVSIFFEIQYTRRGNKAGWDVGEGLLLGYSTKRCQFGFVIFSDQFEKNQSWRGNLETIPLKADKSKFPVFICLCMGIRDMSRKNEFAVLKAEQVKRVSEANKLPILLSLSWNKSQRNANLAN